MTKKVAKVKAQKQVKTEYIIIRAQTAKELQDEVSSKLRHGYSLAGGVQVVMPDYDANIAEFGQRIVEFIQAVYKNG